MIKDEEIQSQIRERARMLLTPSSEQDGPVEHAPMDTIDESGAYQVYEVIYKKSIPVKKHIVAEYLSRQEARDLVREYRNILVGNDVITKGYGFEKMSEAVS